MAHSIGVAPAGRLTDERYFKGAWGVFDIILVMYQESMDKQMLAINKAPQTNP